LTLLAPVVKNRKGFHTDVAEWAAKHGYAAVRADGKIYSTSERLRLDRFREHDVEIVVGALKSKARTGGLPPQQLIDEALKLGHGTLFTLGHDGAIRVHSTSRACPGCGKSFEALDPKFFSYNSSQGWCGTCRGFGELFYLPEVERGARADAIEESWFGWQEGKREICPECNGARLNPIARAVRLDLAQASGREIGSTDAPRTSSREASATIADIGNAPVAESLEFFSRLKFKGRESEIARDILPEIRERLKFLCEVGLGYLQLGRSATTLSGGDAQRIRLAAQLGSNLSGVLYVLDEPTIGLHARDNEQLLSALEILKSRGNSLVVVEHDEETMRRADHVIDLGPGAGVHGGEIVATGTLKELMRHKESITGLCLRGKQCFPQSGKRRATTVAAEAKRRTSGSKVGKADRLLASSAALNLSGASVHNLKNLTVDFPLYRFVVVTGVSGSGKSTLVRECLLPMVEAKVKLKNPKAEFISSIPNLKGMKLKGHESVQSVYEVDQSPIGRTPRSIPATYVGFFDEIRQV
ncbi:MAG: excinuclease ABC subunit A, partial [Verrucomicrobiota bacterium]